MNIIKTLAISVIALGGACAAYFYRDRIAELITPKGDGKPQGKRPGNNRQGRPADALEEVCKAFSPYAENFEGLYEKLYKASEGLIPSERKRNVLTEWDIRMGNIGNAPACLKQWWMTVVADKDTLSDESLQDRAKRVLEMLHGCKIIRDDRKELTATGDTTRYYQCADGETWSVGQTLRVTVPCWYLPVSPTRILEKGYCEIL